VIGRTSINIYKGTTKSIAEIGGELRADYLVESSIRSDRGDSRFEALLARCGFTRGYHHELPASLG
jgi:TolB-like protein